MVMALWLTASPVFSYYPPWAVESFLPLTGQHKAVSLTLSFPDLSPSSTAPMWFLWLSWIIYSEECESKDADRADLDGGWESGGGATNWEKPVWGCPQKNTDRKMVPQAVQGRLAPYLRERVAFLNSKGNLPPPRTFPSRHATTFPAFQWLQFIM